MSALPKCLQCGSEYTYEDRSLYVCPECAHEWPQSGEEDEGLGAVINDANGMH